MKSHNFLKEQNLIYLSWLYFVTATKVFDWFVPSKETSTKCTFLSELKVSHNEHWTEETARSDEQTANYHIPEVKHRPSSANK